MFLVILWNSQENTCARISSGLRPATLGKLSVSYHSGLYTTPPQNFFSFEPWLDTLKLDKNPKFQALQSSGTLLFQSLRIGLLDQKWLSRCRNGGYPMLADFNFWDKFLPNNPTNWTWKALDAEESKNCT